MSNFIQLVRNEQIKLYARKSTWIMVGFLAILAIGGGILTKFIRSQQDQPQQDYDGWQYVLENAGMSSIITLFVVIVAAGIIADEFKWGTIKLLLIRPVSRTKILFAKYVSVLIFALTLLVALLVFSWLIGAIMFGLNGMNPSIVQDQMQGSKEVNVINEIVKQYGFKMVNLIMMSTFAFMISAIFRSSGMAIGLAIFLMFAGTTAVAVVAMEYDWAKYILFANTDLTQYSNQMGPIVEGMTMTFSVVVLSVYFVIFLLLSWWAFTKRDVAGN